MLAAKKYSSKYANIIFPAATFVSAVLMFILQPLFAKMLTPIMGGSPAVWNTALVFYQATLLIGYFYAHLITNNFNRQQQFYIHATLLILGALFLPIKITSLMGEPNYNSPVLWTFGVLFLSIGFPIIAISATAPLVQAWRAKIGDNIDPYKLYAASNLGSFLALALYPFIIEPLIGAKSQSYLWLVLYIALAFLLFMAWSATPEFKASKEKIISKTSNVKRLIWIFYAAIPSALLVSVTGHIVTDIASVPLLWLPPLALFLLTFVIAFGGQAKLIEKYAAPLKYFIVFMLAGLMAADKDDGILGLFIHLLSFFIIVLCCHIELANKKPEAEKLTEFYLLMSLGGFLGGAFAALIAPILFNTTIEYQILLALSLFIAPWKSVENKQKYIGLMLVVVACMWFYFRGNIGNYLDINFPFQIQEYENSFWSKTLLYYEDEKAGAIFCALLISFAFLLHKSPLLVSVVAGFCFILPVISKDSSLIKFRERNFFGVLEISDSGTGNDAMRYLSHGTTLHGQMSLDPLLSREPMSYYYKKTPIGLLFAEASEKYKDNLHAGVIGLGMGSTACYAKPNQDWRFYEINSAVIDATVKSDLVGFVPRCAPDAKIMLGDARLSIKYEKDNWFDILLVDAFSSDSIPTHMITKEAIELLMSKVKNDGILIVHISNRYLDLKNIVADGAHASGYHVVAATRDADENDPADTGVTAMIIAKSKPRLSNYSVDIYNFMEPRKKPKAWTDDHTDIMQAIWDNR